MNSQDVTQTHSSSTAMPPVPSEMHGPDLWIGRSLGTYQVGVPWYAMELIEGVTLRHYVAEETERFGL